MSFEKGHKLAKGGARPGAGRKKTPSTLIKEALVNNDQRLPELFDNLYKLALSGDREATINLIDRSLGKVRTRTELEVTRGEELLGPRVVVKLYQMMDEHNKQQRLHQAPGQLAKDYAEQYGARENWPDWAIKAVETKQIGEGSQELGTEVATISPKEL